MRKGNPVRIAIAGPVRLAIAGPVRLAIAGPVRLAIAGAVIATGSVVFVIAAWASTPAVTCPVTSGQAPAAGATHRPVTAGIGEELQVTVHPLVFVRVESGVLRVSTNTGRPPARTDGFYLIRRGRARHAPERVVERVLRSCR